MYIDTFSARHNLNPDHSQPCRPTSPSASASVTLRTLTVGILGLGTCLFWSHVKIAGICEDRVFVPNPLRPPFSVILNLQPCSHSSLFKQQSLVDTLSSHAAPVPPAHKPREMSAKISFATFLIICPTCFFLGILFTNWSYDHHTLWNGISPSEPILAAIESHYRLLSSSPPIIIRVLHIIVAVGLFGFITKLYKPSESNMLFDGASLVLYMIGLIMYATNVVRGLNTVESGEYTEEVGRVDTLRVLAASQVILALVLVGVLVLQSGQWYAERKESEEARNIELEEEAKRNKGKKKN